MAQPKCACLKVPDIECDMTREQWRCYLDGWIVNGWIKIDLLLDL
jgi:hypothetical protein